MVGDFTEGQLLKIRKMHQIHGQLVRDVFTFYKTYNALYECVFPDDEVLNGDYPDDVIDDAVLEHVGDEDGSYGEGIRDEQDNVRGRSDTWHVISHDDEHVVLERRLGLTDDLSPVIASEHPLSTEARDQAPPTRDFMIRQSSKFSNDINGDLLARMFPHLFPFGRGHPGERRRQTVSMKECVKHYLALCTRQFAEDELLALVAFDRISMMNMYVQNSFRCRRLPHLYDGFESIGLDQIGSALLENERRQQGCLPRANQIDSVTGTF